jgi:hypothetical protein
VAQSTPAETPAPETNDRPLSLVILLSRLLREKVAGAPYAEHFLADKVETEMP